MRRLWVMLWLWVWAAGDLLLARTERTGAWGERWAARLLRANGCRILGRNVRPCRYGELDIIARAGKVFLFVEVKTRRSEVFGRPLEAVNVRKRRLLRRCATHWLAQARLLGTDVRYRFDAVEVVGAPGRGRPRMRWVKRLDMSCTRVPEV